MSSGLRRGVLGALGSGLVGPAGRWGCRLPPGCRGRSSMNVFDREMKKKQKNWAASVQEGQQYDYLRDEVSGPPGPPHRSPPERLGSLLFVGHLI